MNIRKLENLSKDELIELIKQEPRQAIDTAPKFGDWISTDDHSPEPNQVVLIILGGRKEPLIARYTCQGYRQLKFGEFESALNVTPFDSMFHYYDVSHWTELPPLPDKETHV